MASTLKVKIEENIILDNQDYGSKRTLEIGSIDEVSKRIVTCVASQTTTVAVFSGTVNNSAGAIDIQDSKYIRVTNLDSSNSVEIAIVGAATLYQVTLAAGQSHILGSADTLMLAEADTSPSFGTMADITSIQVNPGGNAVSVEVFVASA
tara:strand:- start:538 stop:987 length:450 start_codon:yes stop_codon:yes gene_type:complete